MNFTTTDLSKLIGISVKDLTRMAQQNLIPHYKTKSGFIRFTVQDIYDLSPTCLEDKFEIGSTYIRPRKILSVSYTLNGGGMEHYKRNAKESLHISSGLDFINAGVLSRMIDLMAVHDNQGVPVEPPSYIAGLLGCGERKWTQTLKPALIGAHKIKIVKRGGVKVYVWHDIELMEGPRALVQGVEEVTGFNSDLVYGGPEFIVEPDPVPVINIVPIETPTAPQPDPVSPQELIPQPSAYEILKRAGIDVDNHPRGEFYWARAEHNEIINEWLKTVPLSEIVVRIDKARIAGQLQDHQNSMGDFDEIVMGQV